MTHQGIIKIALARIALAFALVVPLASCSSSDDGDGGGSPPAAAGLTGYWQGEWESFAEGREQGSTVGSIAWTVVQTGAQVVGDGTSAPAPCSDALDLFVVSGQVDSVAMSLAAVLLLEIEPVDVAVQMDVVELDGEVARLEGAWTSTCGAEGLLWLERSE